MPTIALASYWMALSPVIASEGAWQRARISRYLLAASSMAQQGKSERRFVSARVWFPVTLYQGERSRGQAYTTA